MISDLDEAIKKLLITKGEMVPSQVDIKFETPDREWSASISKPTVNIYLYDIRENHHLRGTEWGITKSDDGKTIRKKNPSRVDVSYLITVWANDALDEHRILWRVMSTLFGYPELPEDVLSGGLTKYNYPIKTTTIQPDGLFSNPADFWSALDNKIKASINYVVTLPLDTEISFTAPMVRTAVLDVKPPDADAERIMHIAGVLHNEGKSGQSLQAARVFAKEAEMVAMVDDNGSYSFKNIQAGKHTFQVIVGGKVVKNITVTIPSSSYDLEI
jgi:hypothetical protein